MEEGAQRHRHSPKVLSDDDIEKWNAQKRREFVALVRKKDVAADEEEAMTTTDASTSGRKK